MRTEPASSWRRRGCSAWTTVTSRRLRGSWTINGTAVGPTPQQAAPLLARIREAVDPATAEVIERLRAALSRRDLCREPSDGLLQRFGAYEIYLAHLDQAETWIDRLRLLRAGPRLNLRVTVVGNRGNWRDSGIAEVRSCSPRQRSGASKRWRWRATRRSAGSSRAWKLSPAGLPTSAA